ncbi:MAG: hydroxymethylbilane synthase [Nitrospirae bacterium]|nr:hydroxymethylbilane synthase [Nitrospirota bacterium]
MPIIGTRGSNLALTQARAVQAALAGSFPAISFEIKVIHTQADRLPAASLADLGGKGLFIKEIEEALLQGQIDLGVHSLKDMMVDTTPGLSILAVTAREDPRDCLVSRTGRALGDLPAGSVIGTSSLRRKLLAHHLRPDLNYVPIRGNIETRLRKVSEGVVDGTIMAMAALHRLGCGSAPSDVFDPDVFVPAAGQGSLAVEGRTADEQAARWAAVVQDSDAQIRWESERALLHRLGGGCRVPIGAHARVRDGRLFMKAVKGTDERSPLIRVEGWGTCNEPAALGLQLADAILDRERRLTAGAAAP